MLIDLWILFGVISGLIFGSSDIFTKLALEKLDVRVVVLGAFVWAALFWVPVLSLAQIGLSPVAIEKDILWQAPTVHAFILLKASLLVFSSIAAFTAVKSLPITISSALRSTGSLFVLVGSLVTMGVFPKMLQLVGLLLGVTSLLIYSWPSSHTGPSEAQPRFILLMFLAVITAAFSLVIDKFLIANHGINGRSIQFLADIYRVIGASIIYLIVFRIKIRLSDLLAPPVIAAGILMSLGEFIYFMGLEIPDSDIAILSMLRKFSLITIFFAGVFLFREKNVRRKAGALGLLLTSLILIAVSR